MDDTMELSDFYRKLGRLTLPRVQVFDEEKVADGPSVSVGRGDNVESPRRRLVLNNKGVRRACGGTYESVTRLAAEAPLEGLFEDWPLWQRRPLDPQDALDAMTLEVEDASPDSTLGVVLLLARLARCDLTLFPVEWIQAAESWEKTGMVPDPKTSWATLCSALAHQHFPIGQHATNAAYAEAWRDTLRLRAHASRAPLIRSNSTR